MDSHLLLNILVNLWLLHLTELSGSILPSLGDVRLFNNRTDGEMYTGEAQIYISNGASPTNWSRMCNHLNSSTISFSSYEAVTFCKQLGYSEGKIMFGQESSDYPIWIANIDCDRIYYSHILRCNYEIGDYSECAPVFVKCSMQKDIKWNGSLELCPPNDLENAMYIPSVSFGIVGITLHGLSRAILGDNITPGVSKLADLMCMSMGFQRVVPGSINTLQVFNTLNFSKCLKHFEYHAWIGLSNMECDPERENSCIGCCFKNPPKEKCVDTACVNNFLIIQCTFDMFESLKSIEPTCDFAEYSNSTFGNKIEKYDDYCSSKQSEFNWKFIVGFAVSGFCYVILCIVCTPGFIYGIHRAVKDFNRHREDPL